MRVERTGMIVLASKQLWPNLTGLVHWHKNEGGINRLFIYHSNNETESRKPADRLASLCGKLFPEIEVTRLPGPGGILPCDVWQQIRAWMEACPDCTRWVVNATGGLKLMFAGAAAMVGRPGCEVVYRELSSWYRLMAAASGAVPDATPIRNIDPSESDDLDVVSLVTMQFDDVGTDQWSSAPALDLDIETIVRTGLDHDWDWQKIFEVCGYLNLTHENHGPKLFEQFVGALIKAFGVRQTVTNLHLAGPEGRDIVEIDVVANSSSRLIIVDCKLSNEDDPKLPPWVDQVNRGNSQRNQLGGLNARYVLLRPNLEVSAVQRSLAEASRLVLLDKTDMPRFFSKFSEIIGAPLPEELQEAEAILKSADDEGARIFTSTPREMKMLSDSELAPGMFSLDRIIKNWQIESGRSWVMWRYRGRVHIQGDLTKKMNLHKCREKLEKIVGSIARVEWVSVSGTGNSFYAVMLPVMESGAKRTFDDFLKSRCPTDFLVGLSNTHSRA